MTHKHNPYIDTVKGFAILLVIMGHIIQRTMVANGENFFEHPVFKAIYIGHMPIFFFISGWLLGDPSKRRSVSQLLKNRWESLAKPYVIWSFFGFIITMVGMYVDQGKIVGNPAAILVDQMIVHPVLWFLWALWWIICAISLFVYSSTRRAGPGILLMWLMLLACPTHDSFGMFYIQWFYPFVAVGFLMRRLNIDWQRFNGPMCGLCLSIAFIAVYLGWSTSDYIYVHQMHFQGTISDNIINFAYRYASSFIGVGFIFFLAHLISKSVVGEYVTRFGTYSLGIYLVQVCLVEVIYGRLYAKSQWHVNTHGFLFNGLMLPSLTLVAAGVCWTLTDILKKRGLL